MQSIGVLGGGTMGTGIGYVFAAAGFSTTIVEPDDQRAETMTGDIERAVRNAITRGKLTEDGRLRMQTMVTRVRTIGELPSCLDLVIETVPERLDMKRSVLQQVDARRPHLIASNTSSISIASLASSVSNPDRFLGMHFFNPVWSLALVELIQSTHTSDETVKSAQAFVAAIGKQSIVVRDVPGFATSRLDLIASLEAMRMLEDGVASAEDIDRAAELAYRHPVGPLRLSDIVGLDVRLDIARQLEQTYGERYRPPQILLEKVRDGHLGRKANRGFYEWPDGAKS